MRKNIFFVFFMSWLALSNIVGQEQILLYPEGVSESNNLKVKESYRDAEFIRDISEPRMLYFPVSHTKKRQPAVLICPGGGYGGVAIIKEGEEIARWFNSLGINAFVLYYRMPNGHHKIPLKDAQRALQIIRKESIKWNISKSKIGVMGFSAGGHLAATVATQSKKRKNRANFAILAYPVVTMNETFTHKGSQRNLLGVNPSDELIIAYSNELQVTSKTPPTFLFHAEDDKVVPILNSERFVEALQAKKIPAALYSFPKGGHGFGMRPTNSEADKWPEMLKNWLVQQKIIR